MWQSLLLPVDGSTLAERAAPFASRLAKAADARLILLRVIPVLTAKRGGSELDQQHDLDELAKRLAADGVKVTPRVCFVGFEEVGAAIIDIARQEHVNLIVMSTHGRGGLDRMLYGSVADQVVREAPIPVCLLPSRAAPLLADEPIGPVILPLDGSTLSEAAIEPATTLARLLSAPITLTRAIDPVRYYGSPDAAIFVPTLPEEAAEKARRDLEVTAANLRESGIAASVRVSISAPAREILAAAKEASQAIIVMATHGYGGLQRVVMGSVAGQVLQDATTPVILTRAPVTRSGASPMHLQTTRPGRVGGAAAANAPDGEPLYTITLAESELALLRRILADAQPAGVADSADAESGALEP